MWFSKRKEEMPDVMVRFFTGWQPKTSIKIGGHLFVRLDALGSFHRLENKNNPRDWFFIKETDDV